MKKILILLAVCPVFLLNSFAVTKSLKLGGKDGWHDIQKLDGVTEGKGRFGYPSIELVRNSPAVSDYTDMLLHFENGEMVDSSGRYKVISNDFILTDDAAFGKGAALSRGTGHGMLLEGSRDSMFGGGGRIGSFSIEFWLAPSISENGERFFSWRSSRTVGDYPVYQTITATFFNNHLEWRFSNIFEGYSKNKGEVLISGTTTIIPDSWTRHKVSYDEESGLLEYSVNGVAESMEYLTSTGHEGGDIYQMVLGVPAYVSLCPQYTGRLDDFRIIKMMSGEVAHIKKSDNPFADSRFELYKIDGGRFLTKPIKVMQGSVLTSIDAIMDVPSQTSVQMYIRAGDNYFGWTDDSPEWIPVEQGKTLAGIAGSFFQFSAELLPDGGGRVTPSITQITLNYDEISPPLPPFSVKAESGDGCVTITWSHSADESAGGYYVYYGNRPGEYIGRYALEGSSPVNAGKATSITLSGLKNGSLYYFSVASFSNYDDRIIGPFSKEVFARPKK
ncbi:MAG: hypothetical protein K5640_02590 [Treponema sp.]|nr:hypothetical protein [Treponema sp.]